jgi:hypothetical protein
LKLGCGVSISGRLGRAAFIDGLQHEFGVI